MKSNSGMRDYLTWSLLIAVLLVSSPLRAQDDTDEPAESAVEAAMEPESQTEALAEEESSAQSAGEIAQLKVQIAKQEEVIGKLQERLDALSQRFDESEESEYELLLDGTDHFEPTFRVYGFFDLNLYLSDLPDAPKKNLVAEDLSFVVNRLNLYFSSQMTRTLGALVEVRFTFLPLGADESFEDQIIFQTPYQRVDTTVMDPFTTENVALGGLLIERVHLTWKPMEEFGIIAGRFLTPYGIWNVEHGSPVRVSILSPYFMIRELIPSAQTGVQIFGKFFPYDNTYLDYALTVSNNRGPAESVYDLSDNKAFGLRLKGSYEKEDFSASLGGYLYYGTVKDIKKRMVDFLPRFRLAIDKQYEYEEMTGSLDLLIKLFRARLQVEFIRGMVIYSKRDMRMIPILDLPAPTMTYQPDHLRTGIYALLGYEFLFSLGDGQGVLTPYASFEYTEPEDTFPSFNEYMIRGGLNFKPSPFVTLKAEIMHGIVPDPLTDEDIAWSYQTYATQMAVSF